MVAYRGRNLRADEPIVLFLIPDFLTFYFSSDHAASKKPEDQHAHRVYVNSVRVLTAHRPIMVDLRSAVYGTADLGHGRCKRHLPKIADNEIQWLETLN